MGEDAIELDSQEGHRRKKQVIYGRMIKINEYNANLLLITQSWPSLALDYQLPTQDSKLCIVAESCPLSLQRRMNTAISWLSISEATKLFHQRQFCLNHRFNTVLVVNINYFLFSC